MVHRLLVVLVFLFGHSALDPSAKAAPPKSGERHSDFTLPHLSDGKPIRLSQFRGQKVLLIQFASW